MIFHNRQNQSRTRSSLPSCTEDLIPVRRSYPDGIFELENGKYSGCFRFTDADYLTLDKEDRENVFLKYEEILNALDEKADTKITLAGRKTEEEEFVSAYCLAEKNDGLDGWREEYNKNICQRGLADHPSAPEMYLTVTVARRNADEAAAYFARTEAELGPLFLKIGSSLHFLGEEERLKILYGMTRKGSRTPFVYSGGERKDSADVSAILCPEDMEIRSDYMTCEGRYCRVLYLRDYANFIRDSFLSELVTLNENIVVSLDAEPERTEKAIKQGENRLLSVETTITNWIRKQNNSNLSSAVLPYDLEKQREESREFLDDLVSRDQRMIPSLFTVFHSAATKEQLDEDTEKIIACGKKHMCAFAVLRYQMPEGFATCIPYGGTEIGTRRTLTTESLGVFLPFRSKDYCPVNGIYLGTNTFSGKLITVDRSALQNGNSFITGVSGSGKSMMAKQQIFAEYLKDPDCEVIVIDPEREYGPLIRSLGGECVEISPSGKGKINLLDMNRDYADGANPVSFKSGFLLSVCEELKGSLSAEEKSVIDRCVGITYREYLKNGCEGEAPTFGDFKRVLEEQGDETAKGIALSLELFTDGSLDSFSQKTNVDIGNRLVCFDIRDIGRQLMPLGMLAVLDNIYNRMIRNRNRGVRTYLFIDEIYLLFKHPYSADFLYTLWKRVRKYGAFITGITQNVEDLLISETSRTMLSNSELVLLFNQAAMDREKLKNLFHISDLQMKSITDAEAGKGLVRIGGSLIPFENILDRNSRMYALMTTKFGE